MIFGLRNVMLFTRAFKQLNKSDIAELSERKKEQCGHLHLHEQYRFRSSSRSASSTFAKILIFTKIVLTVISLA